MPDAPRRPPSMAPWFDRLRPARSEDEAMDRLLAEAADVLGFRSAAIVLARDTTREFEYVALHGDEDAELLHTHLPWDYVMSQVRAAHVVGAARYLCAEDRAELGLIARPAPRASARAWHADDLLMGVLKEGGELRGLLVLDDPIDGRVPSDVLKARLHEWTRSHAAEVLASDERRRAEEGAALAESAVAILRLLRAHYPSPVDRAQACLEALRVALDGRSVLFHLTDGEVWRRIDSTVSVPDVVDRDTWRRTLPLLQRLQPGATVLLAPARRLGDAAVVSSLVEVVELWQMHRGSPQLLVVPLIAQRELLGLVAVSRAPRSEEWSDLEIALARRICLDLARTLTAPDRPTV